MAAPAPFSSVYGGYSINGYQNPYVSMAAPQAMTSIYQAPSQQGPVYSSIARPSGFQSIANFFSRTFGSKKNTFQTVATVGGRSAYIVTDDKLKTLGKAIEANRANIKTQFNKYIKAEGKKPMFDFIFENVNIDYRRSIGKNVMNTAGSMFKSTGGAYNRKTAGGRDRRVTAGGRGFAAGENTLNPMYLTIIQNLRNEINMLREHADPSKPKIVAKLDELKTKANKDFDDISSIYNYSAKEQEYIKFLNIFNQTPIPDETDFNNRLDTFRNLLELTEQVRANFNVPIAFDKDFKKLGSNITDFKTDLVKAREELIVNVKNTINTEFKSFIGFINVDLNGAKQKMIDLVAYLTNKVLPSIGKIKTSISGGRIRAGAAGAAGAARATATALVGARASRAGGIRVPAAAGRLISPVRTSAGRRAAAAAGVVADRTDTLIVQYNFNNQPNDIENMLNSISDNYYTILENHTRVFDKIQFIIDYSIIYNAIVNPARQSPLLRGIVVLPTNDEINVSDLIAASTPIVNTMTKAEAFLTAFYDMLQNFNPATYMNEGDNTFNLDQIDNYQRAVTALQTALTAYITAAPAVPAPAVPAAPAAVPVAAGGAGVPATTVPATTAAALAAVDAALATLDASVVTGAPLTGRTGSALFRGAAAGVGAGGAATRRSADSTSTRRSADSTSTRRSAGSTSTRSSAGSTSTRSSAGSTGAGAGGASASAAAAALVGLLRGTAPASTAAAAAPPAPRRVIRGAPATLPTRRPGDRAGR